MPKLIYHDSDGVDKVINLGAEPLLIGRATECHIQTQDAMVSRKHARITWDGNYWIEDLGSSNGVYVGNEKVTRAPIRPGDTVTCGSLVLKLMPDSSPRPSLGGSAPTPLAGTAIPASALGGAGVPASALGGAGVPASALGGAGVPASALGGGVAASVRAGGAPPPAAPPPPSAPPMAPPPTAPPPAASLAQTYAPPPAQQLRAAAAAPDAATGGSPGSLEAKLRLELESQLKDTQERLRQAERKVEQLTADLKRARGGAPPEAAPPDDAEKERLRKELKAAQDELKRARSAPPPATNGAAVPTQVADAAILLSDTLAELRASLRAASGEAVLLKEPEESVSVVQDALKAAAEQLEGARTQLRSLAKLLGV